MISAEAANRIFRIPIAGRIVQRGYRGVRWVTQRTGARWFMRRYLQGPGPHKLHLGASGAGIAGWLNTDLEPTRWPTLRLDARRPFPLPSGAFDYVFSEHMIEHVPLESAATMIDECFRVLKPGGRVRVASPDLARVLQLYNAATTNVQAGYLNWAEGYYRPPIDVPLAVAVINSLFRDHGHQFLFDEESLSRILRRAGFVEIARHAPGHSGDPQLRNLEIHHKIIGHLANNYETMVLEAQKP